MSGLHTGQATEGLAGRGAGEAKVQAEEGRGQRESGAQGTLGGQGAAAVGDIDQRCTEKMDKQEA